MAILYEAETQEVIDYISDLHGNVPFHRQAARHQYSFSSRPFAEQLAVWNKVWHTQNHFWIRVHAFFFLEKYMKKEQHLREMWPVIVSWQDEVDDWGLCDALAKVYTRILELMPDEVFTQLQQWNLSADPWKRRQSVVSLLYYSRTKKKFLSFEAIAGQILPLLEDSEYYVQKGVGWTLREMYNVYPEKTLQLMSENIKRISSKAFPAAIEKMPVDVVGMLKDMRR